MSRSVLVLTFGTSWGGSLSAAAYSENEGMVSIFSLL